MISRFIRFSSFAAIIPLVLGGCREESDSRPDPQKNELTAVTIERQAPPPTNPTGTSLPATGQITTSVPGVNPPPPQPELSPAQKQAVLDQMMKEMADAQAKGLGNGTVTVNGAWHYNGFSTLAPDPNAALPARLVAVDVTIEGHNVNFDIDDIEIIDGFSKVSYGSDPHVTFLSDAAKPLEESAAIPVAPEPTRALLIYAFPQSTAKFTLYYWGKDLLEEPMTFDANGWGLPYPKDSNTP